MEVSPLNVNDIIKLIDKVDSTSIHDIKIVDGQFNLNISKSSINENNSPIQLSETTEKQYTTTSEIGGSIQDTTTPEDDCGGNVINAPLVGIYYISSSPDSKPFINVGDRVNEGDVVCIIEAMKVFNEIKSPYSGIVKKILVSNQEIVEYEQPMIIIGEQL